MKKISIFVSSLKKALKKKQDKLFFLGVFLFLSLLVLGFQYYIYGNLFISFFSILDFILLFLLLLQISLLVVFQHYNLSNKRNKEKSSIIGYFGLIPAFIAACPSCLIGAIGIFGFVSIGFLNFLAQYKTWILLGVVVLEFIPLYFMSKRITGHCKNCEVKQQR